MEGDQKKYGYMTSDGYTYHLLLEKARYNRSHPTEAESMLWNYLRKGQLGCKFRRQHPVYDYIPDFVCIPLKLIIEVDGGYHNDDRQKIDDEERTSFLESEGYQVFRFSNEEVLNDIVKVIQTIKQHIKERRLFMQLLKMKDDI